MNFQIALASCSEGQIDINNASNEELQGITGIGPTYATRIIQNRPFETLDDLLEVKGIGEVTLADIKAEGMACIDIVGNEANEQGNDQEDQTADEDSTNLNIAPTVEVGEVVINEIAWMGSSASSKDEWIELKNTTSRDIDISGWIIEGASSGSGVLIIPEDNIISANNFYLISYYSIADRIIDPETTVLDVIVDWRVKNMGDISLANTNNGNLVLKDREENIIDIAKGDKWAAGAYKKSEGIYYSMERNTPPKDGSLIENWHTATDSRGFIAGAVEKGSPGKENSSFVPQGGEEQEDKGDQDENTNENLGGGGHLNFAPQAEAGENIVTNMGSTINFDASASSDPDNDDLTYYWNLGNGETSEEESFDYNYYYPGKYLVSLQVSDGKLQSRDSLLVTILADGLILSEALPNPKGNDKEKEWIELYNKSDQAINISSWQLDDQEGGSSPFILPDHSLILPHSYLVFKREVTGISLNNTNDEIRLLYPSGEIADEVIYDNCQEGQAIAKKAQQFFWTSVSTPGIDNIIYLEEELLHKLQKDIQQPHASSSQEVSLTSGFKQVALEQNVVRNDANKKHIFQARIPTVADLDNILKIKQVLAQNDIENSLEKMQLKDDLRADISKQHKTFFLNKIIQKPEFILFTSFILSGLILGVWVNLFFKRYV